MRTKALSHEFEHVGAKSHRCAPDEGRVGSGGLTRNRGGFVAGAQLQAIGGTGLPDLRGQHALEIKTQGREAVELSCGIQRQVHRRGGGAVGRCFDVAHREGFGRAPGCKARAFPVAEIGGAVEPRLPATSGGVRAQVEVCVQAIDGIDADIDRNPAHGVAVPGFGLRFAHGSPAL